MNWNQPICEVDWIKQNSEFFDGALSVRMPVRVAEPVIERCAWCGEPTIFGVYLRADPRHLPYPSEEPDGDG